MELVLASSSAWRLGLLEEVGIRCRAVPPSVDEALYDHPDPAGLARVRAAAKARDVARREVGAMVLGVDQVVHIEGSVLGKPRDPEDHLHMLRRLRGRWHQLVTAMCLVGPGGARERCMEEVSRLLVRADLLDEELAAYVRSGDAAGCGGGYRVEGSGLCLFSRIEGDWTNIVGLPVIPLVTALREEGWRLQGRGLAPAPGGA